MLALLVLKERYRKSPDLTVSFYLSHTRGINNWDLVDLSAPYILGDYLVSRTDRKVLYDLARSSDIWKQRIAVVSTLMLIRNDQFDDTVRLAEMFIVTKHDLIQKSTGWMLREVGKRNQAILFGFLVEHKDTMPRTMLRYAIEKFSEEQRKHFLERK